MSDTAHLSIAYIESRPDRAARALESLQADDAAALLASVPVRIAGLALARMNPWNGARCIENIPVERAAGIIQQMPFLDAAALLRMATDTSRAAILDGIPDKLGRAIQNSLAFPSGTVGAQMDKLAPSMEVTRTVADALKFARQKRRPKGDIIFLTGSGRAYVGVIRISELLRHDSKVTLDEVMETGIAPILARSTLSAVESHQAWDQQSILPVVGRKGNFLGALSRANLAAGHVRRDTSGQIVAGNALIQNMIVGYAVTIYGLLKLILQPAAPSGQEERS